MLPGLSRVKLQWGNMVGERSKPEAWGYANVYFCFCFLVFSKSKHSGVCATDDNACGYSVCVSHVVSSMFGETSYRLLLCVNESG